MAKQVNEIASVESVLPPPPFPDIDHPEDWEVIADGADTAAAMTIRVTLEPEYLAAIVEAAHRENLDTAEFVQRAVRKWGMTLLKDLER